MATLYLTIDDAPSQDLPPKVDRLRAAGVPALFFCEGQKLDANPDVARETIAAGYHLGNHLYSHPYASELSVAEFRDELERTEALIEAAYDAAGVERPAKLFRFPYGDQGGDNKVEFQTILDEFGFRPPRTAGEATLDPPAIAVDDVDGTWTDGDRDWLWTSHVEDWNHESAAEVRDRLAEMEEQLRVDGVELFLFHDAPAALELLDALLEESGAYGVDFDHPTALVASSDRHR